MIRTGRPRSTLTTGAAGVVVATGAAGVIVGNVVVVVWNVVVVVAEVVDDASTLVVLAANPDDAAFAVGLEHAAKNTNGTKSAALHRWAPQIT